MSAPLILTLTLDPASQAFFDAARERWFPPERNFIAAHVTLFHHLPGAQAAAICHHLAMVCQRQSPAEIAVTGLRSLGHGVAYVLEAPPMAALRARLAESWKADLTAQDSQGWRLHVTVQNKVSAASARALLARLSAGFVPFRATATGIAVWRYCGGPWESEATIPFAGRG